MIVELWTNMIIEGKKQFKDVPNGLKPRVRQLLINKGRIDLAVKRGDN